MRGFIVIEMMLIVWAATLIGYGIHAGVVEIKDAAPPCERQYVVDCGDIPVGDIPGMGK